MLPVYNGEKYLSKAIESVLNQTFKNFELILFDDGSSDSSLDIIKGFASRDERIVVLSRENRGLVETLNESISLAKGRYIARMDADDVCYVDRLQKQYEAIVRLDLDILGGAVDLIENGELSIKFSYKERNDEIKASILTWRRNFCHPAVMFKRSLHERYPYEPYEGIEDFVLWIRLAFDPDIAMGNLKDSLIQYRVHSDQVTQSGKDKNWHLRNQLRVMQDVICEVLPYTERAWVGSFEKLLRSKNRFIGRSDIKSAFNYIDAVVESDLFPGEAKIYFLGILYKKLRKKNKPKNKFFILYRIKSRIKKLGAIDFTNQYQLD